MPGDPSFTAIHEAGHVVARFEAVPVMGREPILSVHYVELREGVYGCTSGPFSRQRSRSTNRLPSCAYLNSVLPRWSSSYGPLLLRQPEREAWI